MLAAELKRMLEATGYPVELGAPKTPDSQVTYPHLVLWLPPLRHAGPDLEPASTALSAVIQVTAVGRDQDEVLAACDRAAAQLAHRRPVVDQLDCAPLDPVPLDMPVAEDPKVRTRDGRPIYFAPTQYRVYATPTSA